MQDAAQSKLDQTLKPIKDKIDQYQGGTEVAADLGRLANEKAWSEMPDEEYASGDQPRRTGA